MLSIIIKTVKFVGRQMVLFFIGIRSFFKLVFDRQYSHSESYYPEFANRKKGTCRVFFDQLIWVLKYAYINDFYFLYGFDIKGLRNHKDYIEYRNVFMRRRDKLNNATKFSPVVVLRDKSLFGIVAKAYGIPTPEVLGLVNNGKLYIYSEKKGYDVENYFKEKTIDFFLKKIDGECADGVFHIICENGQLRYNASDISFDYLLNVIMKDGGRYIIQERIPNQHPAINNIYARSINTLRMITVRDQKTGEIIEFSTVLRVGRNGNEVDNWAQGGLAIGVDTEKETLREWGFYKPTYGTKASSHPDTGTVFKDYHLPYVKEAVEMAKRFHSFLPGLHGIGWDIAITENGPCFIEGNDNYEISLNQICNHGLMPEFERYFQTGIINNN